MCCETMVRKDNEGEVTAHDVLWHHATTIENFVRSQKHKKIVRVTNAKYSFPVPKSRGDFVVNLGDWAVNSDTSANDWSDQSIRTECKELNKIHDVVDTWNVQIKSSDTKNKQIKIKINGYFEDKKYNELLHRKGLLMLTPHDTS